VYIATSLDWQSYKNYFAIENMPGVSILFDRNLTVCFFFYELFILIIKLKIDTDEKS